MWLAFRHPSSECHVKLPGRPQSGDEKRQLDGSSVFLDFPDVMGTGGSGVSHDVRLSLTTIAHYTGGRVLSPCTWARGALSQRVGVASVVLSLVRDHHM